MHGRSRAGPVSRRRAPARQHKGPLVSTQPKLQVAGAPTFHAGRLGNPFHPVQLHCRTLLSKMRALQGGETHCAAVPCMWVRAARHMHTVA